MMGDNRDNSSDSRVPPEAGGVGFVHDADGGAVECTSMGANIVLVFGS